MNYTGSLGYELVMEQVKAIVLNMYPYIRNLSVIISGTKKSVRKKKKVTELEGG